MHATKQLTLQEYIEYRNKVVTRARAVGFAKNRYYAIRLQQLDDQYPEFSKIGVVDLAENHELSQGAKDKLQASIAKDQQDLNKVKCEIMELQNKVKNLESSIQFKTWAFNKPFKK